MERSLACPKADTAHVKDTMTPGRLVHLALQREGRALEAQGTTHIARLLLGRRALSTEAWTSGLPLERMEPWFLSRESGCSETLLSAPEIITLRQGCKEACMHRYIERYRPPMSSKCMPWSFRNVLFWRRQLRAMLQSLGRCEDKNHILEYMVMA